MAAFKVGDPVKVVARNVTREDEESGLYYAYFGGLIGTVDKVYSDGSVCVDVDVDSLSDDMRKRHLEMQEDERKRWLDGLSGEVRSRLTPEQRQLTISYRILVSKKDLEKHTGGKPRAKKAGSDESQTAAGSGGKPKSKKGSADKTDKQDTSVPESTAGPPETEAELPGTDAPDTSTPADTDVDLEVAEESAPRRKTQAELEAAEEEYLRSLQNRQA